MINHCYYLGNYFKWNRSTSVNQKFSNILVFARFLWVYHIKKAVKAIEVPAKIGSIILDGMLIPCALLHCVFDLNSTQMNM